MAKDGSNRKGGVTKNDRTLAANVRTLSLRLIQKHLEDTSPENDEYRKALLLKLATTVLPRINEHSGTGGEPIVVQIIGYNANSDDTPQLS